MKTMFLCAGILLLFGGAAMAQAKSKQLTGSRTVPPKAMSQNKNSSNTVSLQSTGSYPAKVNTSSVLVTTNQYTVRDPILTTLDARAKGANVSLGKSGIVGMPKRAYGFANGKLLLQSTSATTSGTQTGSGAVGTGTSQGTFGSNGPAMNVNGKSPYAGINMWGNARNMPILRSDSSVRLTPINKQ
jgi:hypothetical protein